MLLSFRGFRRAQQKAYICPNAFTKINCALGLLLAKCMYTRTATPA